MSGALDFALNWGAIVFLGSTILRTFYPGRRLTLKDLVAQFKIQNIRNEAVLSRGQIWGLIGIILGAINRFLLSPVFLPGKSIDIELIQATLVLMWLFMFLLLRVTIRPIES